MADLHNIVYDSEPTRHLAEEDLGAILRGARRFNADHDVTGCLLVLHDAQAEVVRFAQWLEGPPPAVFECLDRILQDDRHHAVRILREGPIVKRSYPDWTMRDEVVPPERLEEALLGFGIVSLP